MDWPAAVEGFTCVTCGSRHDTGSNGSGSDAGIPGRCPDCTGAIRPRYDYDAVTLPDDSFTVWDLADLLPVVPEDPVTMAEGGLALVSSPGPAGELGVASLNVADDSRNPTGSAAARGATVGLTALRSTDNERIELASAGTSGVAAAAYAGRAGLDCRVVVPARTPFAHKAMINVHGADMEVVGGRYDDALAALRDVESVEKESDAVRLGPFDTPYRAAGAKTAFLEIALRADPDAVVCPVGEGVSIVGFQRAAEDLRRLGRDPPTIHAVQPAGCAPLVDAVDAGREAIEPWDAPDTIAGELEVPVLDDAVLDAFRDCEKTIGHAVTVSDDAILESGVRIAASTGLGIGLRGATAAAAAWELRNRGVLGSNDGVVVYNPDAPVPEADLLRSHLMGQGV